MHFTKNRHSYTWLLGVEIILKRSKQSKRLNLTIKIGKGLEKTTNVNLILNKTKQNPRSPIATTSNKKKKHN